MSEVDHQVSAMRVGGRKLAKIKQALVKFSTIGKSFEEIEQHAQQLIKAADCQPSFSTVPGYNWATCIMKNDQLCHGIPQEGSLQDGDVITIDVGLMEQGYHLDTTITFWVGNVSAKVKDFVKNGQVVLQHAISQAVLGNSVYDVSKVIERELERLGYGAVHQLTGHGIGKQLHMNPAIPCVAHKKDKKQKFYQNQTLAIEVMYAMGNPLLEVAEDGWTFQTKDNSLTGMFEETVLITDGPPDVLTL